jgi:hypothetical protein
MTHNMKKRRNMLFGKGVDAIFQLFSPLAILKSSKEGILLT